MEAWRQQAMSPPAAVRPSKAIADGSGTKYGLLRWRSLLLRAGLQHAQWPSPVSARPQPLGQRSGAGVAEGGPSRQCLHDVARNDAERCGEFWYRPGFAAIPGARLRGSYPVRASQWWSGGGRVGPGGLGNGEFERLDRAQTTAILCNRRSRMRVSPPDASLSEVRVDVRSAPEEIRQRAATISKSWDRSGRPRRVVGAAQSAQER